MLLALLAGHMGMMKEVRRRMYCNAIAEGGRQMRVAVDLLYACGTDGGVYHHEGAAAAAAYKAVNDALWKRKVGEGEGLTSFAALAEVECICCVCARAIKARREAKPSCLL